MARAILALQDGTVFHGQALGRHGTVTGEVVFNTSMTGYQEILTDPSYRGQIVTLTYPLIGNYGVNDEDMESTGPQARGLVVRELCPRWSSWRGQDAAEAFLKSSGIVGITGIDTRALTRRLREYGTMKGALSSARLSEDELIALAQKEPDLIEVDFVAEVTPDAPYVLNAEGRGPHVVMVDYGAKRNILRSLAARDCRVTVVPAQYSAREILGLKPDGVILSNGPGDPQRLDYAVRTVQHLIGETPIFGICLGHQVLGLALGGQTFKLKYGHRGGNHPVQDLATGRVYITSQNHGFAVDEASLPADQVTVSHRNLTDGTVEGLRHKHLPIASVQFHPEAAPGPQDSRQLFDEFLTRLAG